MGGDDAATRSTSTIGVATLFFTNLSDLPFTLLRLEHRPWTFTSFTIGRVLIQVPLAIVFLAVFDWGPAGYLGANLVTAVGIKSRLCRSTSARSDWRWHWQLMKPMLAFAIPALFTGISFFFLKLSDRFFLLHYQGKAVVGLYTVAYSLSAAAVHHRHGVPHGLAAVALRQAERAGEAQAAWSSRSSTYFMALNALMLVLIGVFMPFVDAHVPQREILVRSGRRRSCSRSRWPSTTCTSSSGWAPTSPRRTA